jgi:hypothetical protein
MSYDFRLFLPQPGVDPLVTAQVAPDDEAEEINPGPPIPAKESRKQAIAAALIKVNPALTAFAFGFNEIAKSEGISVERAKERFRHIELNGPENGNGIQITLFDDAASLTLPYWHKDKNAKPVFTEIWQYLTVLQTVAGYQIYDAQLECIIDLASDQDAAIKCYSDVVNQIG